MNSRAPRSSSIADNDSTQYQSPRFQFTRLRADFAAQTRTLRIVGGRQFSVCKPIYVFEFRDIQVYPFETHDFERAFGMVRHSTLGPLANLARYYQLTYSAGARNMPAPDAFDAAFSGAFDGR